MKIKNVIIAGGGVMGSQISWQTAFSGFNVIVYDAFDKGLEAAKKNHNNYAKLFVKEERGTQKEVDEALERLSYTTDRITAFTNADLVSESIPENIDIKKEFWESASAIAKDNAILTTNTSTYAPSQLVPFVTNPSRFSTLHFWSGIWDNNLAEVMGHAGTDSSVNESLVQFAKKIGMVPVPILKEQPGYIVNSLLVPFLAAALKLYFTDVADFKMVDKVWMIPNGKGASLGPFGHMDNLGLNVCYHICLNLAEEDEVMGMIAKKLKENYIDQGKTGKLSGEGFYTYPNPEFESPNFFS